MVRPTRVASTTASNAAQMPPASSSGEKGDCEKVGEDGKNTEGKGGNVAEAAEKGKYVCKGGSKTCGQELLENEDSIMCDGCERWFHPKCQSLSTDAFRALSKYDFAFLCLECRPKLKDIMKLGKQMEAWLEETEKKLMAAIGKINPRDSADARLDEKIACMEDTVIKKKSKNIKLM